MMSIARRVRFRINDGDRVVTLVTRVLFMEVVVEVLMTVEREKSATIRKYEATAARFWERNRRVMSSLRYIAAVSRDLVY